MRESPVSLAYTAGMSVSSLFNAIVVGGLPLFVLSFALVSWALHTRRLSGGTVKALQESMKALGTAQKDKKQRQKIDPVMDKWLRFGGGFYGLVALYTWILIELGDVANFLSGLWDVLISLKPGAIIGLLLELFIESIMNFVAAIAWPAYWLAESRHPFLLLVAAYVGYWFGIKAARMLFRDRLAEDGEVAAAFRDGED